MKKTLKTIIALCLAAGFFSPLAAAEKTRSISTNPLGLIFGAFNATYQHGIGPGNATVGASYYSFTLLDTTISGFGVSGGYRYHWKSKDASITGPFAGPVLSLGSLSMKTSYIGLNGTEELKGSTTFFEIGAIAGYQWVWSSFTTALYGGYSVGVVGDIKVKANDGTEQTIPTSGAAGGIILGLQIGYPF